MKALRLFALGVFAIYLLVKDHRPSLAFESDEANMQAYASLAILMVIAYLVLSVWRLRRKRSVPGPAAAGMMNEILNDERRAAIEIIVEEKTGYRDPEDRDGSLPDLKDRPVIGSGNDR